MNGIQHILSPITASWPAWLMLAMGILIGIFLFQQRAYVQTLAQSFISPQERQYNTSLGIWHHLLLMFLVVLEMALVFDIWLYNGYDFTFNRYMHLVAVMALVMFAQWILSSWVRWVFASPAIRETLYQQRLALLCVVSLLTFAVLFFLLNFPIRSVVFGYLLFLIVGSIVLSFYGGLRIYADGIESVVLVLLYIVFLQIIPIAGLLEYSKSFVS